ncbi:MAG: hypothetical protein NZ561_07295 [Phycisphaerae bacterium]|nr:hypothetical protein [Phycisphaerae bacterium]MDW8262206.1 hypothetical protein [Phycisphaerales bacterium]
MAVTIDQQPMKTPPATLGEVLQQLRQAGRLPVSLCIDGAPTDPALLESYEGLSTADHVIDVQTTVDRRSAREALDLAESAFREALERFEKSAEALPGSGEVPSLEGLSESLGGLQRGQASFLQAARALAVDLERLQIDGSPFRELLAELAGNLRTLKHAVESRDPVTLADSLRYEMPDCARRWLSAVATVRASMED